MKETFEKPMTADEASNFYDFRHNIRTLIIFNVFKEIFINCDSKLEYFE